MTETSEQKAVTFLMGKVVPSVLGGLLLTGIVSMFTLNTTVTELNGKVESLSLQVSAVGRVPIVESDVKTLRHEMDAMNELAMERAALEPRISSLENRVNKLEN